MDVYIDEEVAHELVSFIKPRFDVPPESENIIVERQKEFFVSKLVGKKFSVEKWDLLVNLLKKKFYETLMHPGETVGIICGQCIGECTTQSSLNNFHSAGLDTGVETQIDHLQNIINASKFKTSGKNKEFKLSLFFHKRFYLEEVLELTRQNLNEVVFSDLIISANLEVCDTKIKSLYTKLNPGNLIPWEKQALVLNLSLLKLFQCKIGIEKLLNVLTEFVCEKQIVHIPYSLLGEEDDVYPMYIYHEKEFVVYRKIQDLKLVGIPGVKHAEFKKTADNEWYVDCLGNNLNVFAAYSDIFDLNRIICSSMYDVCKTFGILMTYECIVQKCKEIIPSIDQGYFNILAMRMTKNGVLEPLTRYTMRNNVSPLAKASFEESFETFIKACKYKETEKFSSISSKIICGKKPRIGTYLNDVVVDSSFYLKS